MLRIPADPQQLLKVSLLAFAVLFAPVLTLMLLESLDIGEALFASGVATYTYLILARAAHGAGARVGLERRSV